MKILYIITQSSWGGAQKYVYNLSLNLNKKDDIEVVVAGGEESIGELAQRLLDKNIKFLPIKKLVRRIHPLNDILAVGEIKQIIDQEKPDIVHLNSSKAGAVGSLAAKLAKSKPKVIYTVHGWVFKENLNPLIKAAYFLIEKIFSRCKDRFICLSNVDRQIGIDAKIIKNKNSNVIYNGLNLPNNYFLSKESALESLKIDATGKIIIGAIANFYPNKGLKYLIEATDILANQCQLPIITVIIGDGELRKDLERQIADKNLEQSVILAGTLPEAGKYLKAFDIAVLSSLKEGLPYFILEAMSAGLPIISTNVGGIPEIIENNKNGLLVNPKDPSSLAEKIKYLIKNKVLIQEISKNNIEDVNDKFNLDKMTESTLAIYNQAS